MTFEEFFTKKKIDLNQLEKADPQLYSEFKSHFQIMGEKSFDHSKKFWFNRLRHLYHLALPVKETITQVETKIASQAEPLSSPTIEQSPAIANPADAAEVSENKQAYKPKFKPRSVPVKTKEQGETFHEIKSEEASESQAPPVKKPPFKPRNVKPVSGEPSEDAQKIESRPGQTEVSDTPATIAQEASTNAKPAYKPRFNIRNIPKPPAGADPQTGHTVEQQNTAEPRIQKEEASTTNEEPPKTAYKPRFKMKNIASSATPQDENAKNKDKEAEESQGSEEIPEKTTGPATAEPKGSGSKESPEDPKPKPAYKPKFSMKNIKPKSSEEE